MTVSFEPALVLMFTVSLFYLPAIRPVHLGMSGSHLSALLSLGLGVPSSCHSVTIPELRCQIAGMFGIPVCWANPKWLSQNTHLGNHNRFILCGAVNRDACQMIQSVFVLHPLPSPVHSVANSSWIQE
jgi:hypothetical protein